MGISNTFTYEIRGITNSEHRRLNAETENRNHGTCERFRPIWIIGGGWKVRVG